MRSVSEFIALLMIITLSLIATFIYTSFFGGFLGSITPRVHHLKLSVSSVEPIHTGSATTLSIGGVNFTANYIYRVTMVLYNAGTEPILTLQYSVRSLNPSVLSVGTSNAVDVYDPISLATFYGYQLPSSIQQNQAIAISLVIPSKKDLLTTQNAVLLFVVRGTLPSGESQETQVTLFG